MGAKTNTFLDIFYVKTEKARKMSVGGNYFVEILCRRRDAMFFEFILCECELSDDMLVGFKE